METLVSNKPPKEPGNGSERPRRATAATHKALITRNLRLAFGEVAGEPVPKRFMDLLERIDSAKDGQS